MSCATNLKPEAQSLETELEKNEKNKGDITRNATMF